jgi:tetratricopeptide (TPR) repeat protein
MLSASAGASLPAHDADDEYLRLLERYRAADAGVAAELRGFWSHLYEKDSGRISLLVGSVPIERLPLAAMAQTDLAIAAFEGEQGELANHDLSIAGQLIERLMKKPQAGVSEREWDRRMLFAREWHYAMIWLRLARYEGERVMIALNRGRERFPDDPEVLLSAGTFEEILARRMFIERATRRAPNPMSRPVIERNRHVVNAIDNYRQAIARDPNMAEARIRLAFMLSRQGEHERDEALTLLKEAKALTTKPTLTYLAALFAGDIEDARGQVAAASQWYRTAIAACPRAQTARLAFSHLQLDQYDNARAAQSTLRPLIGGPLPQAGPCEPDPWRLYDFGQGWRLTELLETMRKQVRESAGDSEP